MIIDTTDIKDHMQTLRDADPWQVECMAYLNSAIDVLKAIARVKYNGSDPVEGHQLVAMQTLGIRVLNDIGATGELLSRGYYQPAVTMIRDLMECAFLLDLFSRSPADLQPWIDLGIDAGTKGYKPVQVRERLEELDGERSDARRRQYKLYSSFGAHPNSKGLYFIAPGNEVNIGPFSDNQRSVMLLRDYTVLSVIAGMHLTVWLWNSGIDLVDDEDFQKVQPASVEIRKRFFDVSAHMVKSDQGVYLADGAAQD
jgi:hypothetical protein